MQSAQKEVIFKKIMYKIEKNCIDRAEKRMYYKNRILIKLNLM